MDYQNIINNQTSYFLTDITKNYYFRLNALKTLRKQIIKYELKIYQALKEDLGKSKSESYLTEIGLVLKELSFHIKNLKRFMKVKKVKTPITLFPAKSYLYNEPHGKVLIISPWNYPFLLALNPLIGAISAGNTAVIKPSEFAPKTSLLIKEMLDDCFDERYIKVIEGGIKEISEILSLKFDYIFFTGSPTVGKIIMEKASKHLTPITLELGGKSPVVVTPGVDLKLAAKRIAYGKTINAGQTCIAPDYLMIEESLLDDFVKCYDESIKLFFGNDVIENDNYPKIVNDKNHERVVKLFRNQKILLGGKYNNVKIEPTLILVDDLNSEIMKTEIFGPILPIITYDNIADTFTYIINNEKPLAAYLFTKDKNIKNSFINKISAGGIVINDTVMHFANINLPFGGVGNSGMGKYHGKASFQTFSHEKAIVDRKTWLDLKMRYHQLVNKL